MVTRWKVWVILAVCSALAQSASSFLVKTAFPVHVSVLFAGDVPSFTKTAGWDRQSDQLQQELAKSAARLIQNFTYFFNVAYAPEPLSKRLEESLRLALRRTSGTDRRLEAGRMADIYADVLSAHLGPSVTLLVFSPRRLEENDGYSYSPKNGVSRFMHGMSWKRRFAFIDVASSRRGAFNVKVNGTSFAQRLADSDDTVTRYAKALVTVARDMLTPGLFPSFWTVKREVEGMMLKMFILDANKVNKADSLPSWKTPATSETLRSITKTLKSAFQLRSAYIQRISVGRRELEDPFVDMSVARASEGSHDGLLIEPESLWEDVYLRTFQNRNMEFSSESSGRVEIPIVVLLLPDAKLTSGGNSLVLRKGLVVVTDSMQTPFFAGECVRAILELLGGVSNTIAQSMDLTDDGVPLLIREMVKRNAVVRHVQHLEDTMKFMDDGLRDMGKPGRHSDIYERVKIELNALENSVKKDVNLVNSSQIIAAAWNVSDSIKNLTALVKDKICRRSLLKKFSRRQKRIDKSLRYNLFYWSSLVLPFIVGTAAGILSMTWRVTNTYRTNNETLLPSERRKGWWTSVSHQRARKPKLN